MGLFSVCVIVFATLGIIGRMGCHKVGFGFLKTQSGALTVINVADIQREAIRVYYQTKRREY